MLLLPFSSSGAIQGSVPRTPPETKVFRLILDKPKSPTWKNKFLSLLNLYFKCRTFWIYRKLEKNCSLDTLHIGRIGSFKFTNKLSHFKSKCTIFFECKYSIPKAASIAIISLLRRSRYLQWNLDPSVKNEIHHHQTHTSVNTIMHFMRQELLLFSRHDFPDILWIQTLLQELAVPHTTPLVLWQFQCSSVGSQPGSTCSKQTHAVGCVVFFCQGKGSHQAASGSAYTWDRSVGRSTHQASFTYSIHIFEFQTQCSWATFGFSAPLSLAGEGGQKGVRVYSV